MYDVPMSSIGDPRQVFGSSLPVGASLVVVFVPSRDRDADVIDQERWVDEVLTTLGQVFRGATASPRCRGVWRDDQCGGVLVKEEPIIAFSYAASEDLTAGALTALYRTLSRMGREARQGKIGVVIDGKYYGITDYAGE